MNQKNGRRRVHKEPPEGASGGLATCSLEGEKRDQRAPIRMPFALILHFKPLLVRLQGLLETRQQTFV